MFRREVTMRPRTSPALRFLASLIACVIASPLLAQQPPALVTQSVDTSVRTVLPDNVHPLARAEFDRGEAPPDLPLNRILLVLKRSDQQETALRRLMENQQYKKSPSYHQWLTPEELGARFGPADSDIAAVTNWLQASGFQVSQVSKGRIVIEFSGTAGLVKQAFGTAIHRFVVNGEQHWANVSNPSIPTVLAAVVAGVDSQQGTGTFIAEKRVPPDEVERERQLDQLVRDVAARAGAGGFKLGELVERLKELVPEADRKRRR